jgi:hypothetical protein
MLPWDTDVTSPTGNGQASYQLRLCQLRPFGELYFRHCTPTTVVGGGRLQTLLSANRLLQQIDELMFER